MPKSYIFLMFFFIYSITLLYFGKTGYKEIETIDDFFSGGRKMSFFACISTFVATWFSAASMQGLTGAIYMYGYTFVFYSVVPWFLGAYCLVLISQKLRASNTMTIPEYLNKRYQSKMIQIVGGLVVIINFIMYIVIQIRGFGIVIAEFLEITYPLAIVIVYIFILYTTFGGMFSIAKSDGFNSIIIVAGVLIAMVFILKETTGFNALFTQAKMIEGIGVSGIDYYTSRGSLLDPLAGGHMKIIGLISAFFGWGLGLAANPQYTVRIIAAKDDRTAKKMIVSSIIILSIVYGALVIIGLGSRVILPTVTGIDSVDALFPYIFNAQFPIVVSGIVLLAIMAAAISTANSQLLVVSSSFVYDIYLLFKPHQKNDDQLLKISRIVVFVAGSISLILALSPPETLIVYGGYVWGVFSAVFFLPLYGGVFWSKATKNGAVYSMVAGMVSMIFFIVRNWKVQTIFDINPALPSVVIASLVFFGVSIYEGHSNEVKY